MLAARIFPLARTSRWAMVGSGTRKARAISAVVSPPRSRSVRATWTSAASAGWQHVKIRRSRSSRTATSSTGSSGACRSAAWACRSSREASRRSRSIARLRAVVMIHPAGLGGTPAEGQRCTATTNASWTASSATSMSPKARTRTATARPYCSRNTRSISEACSADTRLSALGVLLEGTYLDRAPAGPGRPGGPPEGGVEVVCPDHPEAADVLLAFGERAVGGEDLAVLDSDDGRGGRRMEPAAEHPGAGRLELGVEGVDVAIDRLHLLGRWGRDAVDHV